MGSHALGGQPLPDGLTGHQVAVGSGVDPLAVTGDVGDAGDQGEIGRALLLVLGHGGRTDGVGGHHHVGLVLVQQSVQSAQQAIPPVIAGAVGGEHVVEVVKRAAEGDQQVEGSVHGGGQLRHGVGKQIHGIGPVAVVP